MLHACRRVELRANQVVMKLQKLNKLKTCANEVLNIHKYELDQHAHYVVVKAT